jgi:pimeloyl-ACP methyl ester carboxylesterase
MLNLSDLVIDQVNTPVLDSGGAGSSASGEAVVFVHGNPGPSDDWETLVPAVAAFSRVVAMDMPGYGRSDRPRSFDYTVTGYARHLGRLIERLGIRRAHLVLHDFGGAWGLGWAVQHPAAVASVTLVNTGVLAGYRWHKFARIWQTPVLGELFQLTSNAPMLHAALNADNPKPMPRAFVDRVMRYADWGNKRAVLKLYRASRHIARDMVPLGAALARLDVPVCVVWGAGDKYLPVAYAQKQRDYFPKAEVHVLEGLGHWPFIDDPDAVARVIVPFLERVTAGSIR